MLRQMGQVEVDIRHAQGTRREAAHPLFIRLTHWIGAAAMICMILSGWTIYNASPILPFVFPRWAGLGGWLAGAIAWHISTMWVLFADGLAYLAYGFATGHFRSDLAPAPLVALRRDFMAALTFRLRHAAGHYNAVQRLLYGFAILDMCASVLTGLSIWKPVQFGWLTWVFGGYDVARVIHFFAMSGIVAFLVVHVVLVALFPSTLVTMVTGGRREVRPAAGSGS